MSSTRKKVSAIEKLISRNEELEARLRDAEQKLAAKERLLDDVAAEQNRLVRLILEARGNTP